jgi:hypothetical protein
VSQFDCGGAELHKLNDERWGQVAQGTQVDARRAGLAFSPLETSQLVEMIDAREAKLLSEKRQAMLEAAE